MNLAEIANKVALKYMKPGMEVECMIKYGKEYGSFVYPLAKGIYKILEVNSETIKLDGIVGGKFANRFKIVKGEK